LRCADLRSSANEARDARFLCLHQFSPAEECLSKSRVGVFHFWSLGAAARWPSKERAALSVAVQRSSWRGRHALASTRARAGRATRPPRASARSHTRVSAEPAAITLGGDSRRAADPAARHSRQAVECLLDVVINGSSEKGAYGRGAGGVSRQKESLNGGLSIVSTHMSNEKATPCGRLSSLTIFSAISATTGEISSEIWVLTNAGKRWRRRLTKRWRG